MRMKNMKKVLSGVILSVYLMVHTAPIALCITSTPAKIDTGISKPVLRATDRPTSLKLEGELSLSKSNPKISLSLRDSDVMQVLRMFADKAGLNIVFHSSVSGKVTLDLVNVPLNEAFKLVMQVTNLTYYVDNNTMVVASAAAAQNLNLAKQDLMIIPVKYVDATILADFLNKNIFSLNKPGLSNAQIAITNPSENQILIFGTKNDFLMAQKIVAQFDVKPREETFIVNHTTPKEMADLVCNVLLKDSSNTASNSTATEADMSSGANASSGSGSESDSNAPSGSNSNGASPENLAPNPSLPSSNIPGAPTGGAASSSGASGAKDFANISLGGGTTACTFNNPVTAGTLASLNTTSLSVTYFPQRGAISIFGGSAQQIEAIKEFIAKNDKKQPQAYLEISIIELNESGMREFNNTWQVYSGFFTGGFNGSTTTNPNYPTFIHGDQYTPVPPTITQYLNNVTGQMEQIADPTVIIKRYADPRAITYSMQYLIRNEKGRVLANPRIMITNGEKSTIDLTSDYVKTVTSQVLAQGGGVAGGIQRTYNVASDQGINVEIEPFISPDGYVTLNIKPDYSTVKEKVTDETTGDLVATLLQRRNLDLKNIRIKDGETLVIGGMIKEDEQKSVAKFPFLGDLPGIGMFFRNTSTTKSKQELVIMLTPKIIKDTEDLVNHEETTL